jgi:hypothetical protein
MGDFSLNCVWDSDWMSISKDRSGIFEAERFWPSIGQIFEVVSLFFQWLLLRECPYIDNSTASNHRKVVIRSHYFPNCSGSGSMTIVWRPTASIVPHKSCKQRNKPLIMTYSQTSSTCFLKPASFVIFREFRHTYWEYFSWRSFQFVREVMNLSLVRGDKNSVLVPRVLLTGRTRTALTQIPSTLIQHGFLFKRLSHRWKKWSVITTSLGESRFAGNCAVVFIRHWNQICELDENKNGNKTALMVVDSKSSKFLWSQSYDFFSFFNSFTNHRERRFSNLRPFDVVADHSDFNACKRPLLMGDHGNH